MNITVNVPDDQVVFFLELVKKLSYTVVDQNSDLDIPGFHELMYDKPSKSFYTKQDDLWDWDDEI